ncbi:MAG: hypothetical protein AYK18_16675 [Theionarchaea archaeon DG-70]|nr:MAG: hypothetical protein AYK18_16675 [Theionarchaea archaeon DG-70]
MAENIEKILEDMQERLKKASNDRVKLFFIIRTKKKIKGENGNKENKGQSTRDTEGDQSSSEENEDQSANQENQPTEEITRYQIEYEILNTKLTPNVRDTFIDIAKKNIHELLETEDLRLERYDPVAVWSRPTVEFIEMSEVEQLDKIQKDMELANLHTYVLETGKVPWAYAAKMDDAKLILFRKFSSSKILERKGWIPLFVKDGVFSRLEEPALTIDEEVDCIHDIKERKMYILNKKEFEAIFSFIEMFVQAIKAKEPLLVRTNLVNNVPLLVNRCRTDPRKARKLYSILEGQTLDQFDAQKVARINRQYVLSLGFTPTGQMVVKPKDIWRILKVLADDYLVSSATILRYEVLSKTSHLPRMAMQPKVNARTRTVTIDGNVINADKVEWDWGDGSKPEVIASPPFIPKEHPYAPGPYTITVTAYRRGRVIEKTFDVEIP